MVVKLLCIVLLALFVANTSADVDCNEHPTYVDLKECCPGPDLIAIEAKQQCKQFEYSDNTVASRAVDEEVTTPRSHPRPRPHPHTHKRRLPPCYYSCVVNVTGILNAEQQLDESKLNAYLSKIYRDSPDFIVVIQESFKTCAAKAAKIAEHMQYHPRAPEPSGGSACHSITGMIFTCAWFETFNNCPTSMWADTQPCNDWRDFMHTCKSHKGHSVLSIPN